MTILELNNFFYRRGGSETALFETIAALEERGHRVVPFAMSHPENEPSEFVGFFPKPAPRWQFWKRFYNPDVAAKLEQLIAEVKPDVAHLHNIAYHLTPAVIAVLRRHHIPIVQTLHDYQAVSPLPLLFSRGKIYELQDKVSWLGVIVRRAVHGSYLDSIAAVFASLLDLLFGWTSSVNRFLAPSIFAANIAARYGLPEEHIRVAHQSIEEHLDCQNLEVRGQTSEVGGKYFLYLGRLAQEKGVDELLEWWARVSPSHRLVIAGTGPCEQHMRERARALGLTNILWFGAVWDPRTIAKLYEGALAVLVPSQWYENAPYTALEAMSHATPVIASDIGGLPELVEDSRGWLVRPEDPTAWVAAVRWVAEHPQDARRRGAQAKEWVALERARSNYAAELEGVFEEAVACERNPMWCEATA